MAWTANPYYKNYKQKDLYQTFYLVDLKQKKIIDKQTLRIDTLAHVNSKLLPQSKKWMRWINAQQFAKKDVNVNAKKIAQKIIAENDNVLVPGYGIVSRKWLQNEIKKRIHVLPSLLKSMNAYNLRNLRGEMYSTGVLKAFLDTEIEQLEKEEK